MRFVSLPLLLVLGLLTACGTPVKNPVTGRSERTVLDEPGEIALGRKEHQLVLQETAAVDNPKLQAYVNALGQRPRQAGRVGCWARPIGVQTTR